MSITNQEAYNLICVKHGAMYRNQDTGLDLLHKKLIRKNYKTHWFDLTPAGHEAIMTWEREITKKA